MKIKKIPPYLLRKLKDRGLTDAQIADLTPEMAFDECCMWEGLIHWGPQLRQWMTDLKASK